MTFYDDNAQPSPGIHLANNELKAINTLYGIIWGMTSDGIINDQEIHFIKTWLLDNSQYLHNFPLNAVNRRVTAILADGHITNQERTDFYNALTEIIGGGFLETGSAGNNSTQYSLDVIENMYFENATFCFTGAFISGTRNQCEAIIEQAGGIPTPSITKKTNYVVIGTIGSRDWIASSHGRKLEKAFLYRDQGCNIRVISEQTWLNFL